MAGYKRGRGECLSVKDPRNNYKIPGIISFSENVMWTDNSFLAHELRVVQSKTKFYLCSRFSLQNCSMCVFHGMHNSVAFYHFTLHTAYLIGQHTPNLPCKIIVIDLILCLRLGRYG